ncbi:MAG: methyltransferase domain-containing protein [Flavobacterium sp.]|nr:MAG: methyltransferase domain-containing protein [Flavobacterium sp.]
MNFYTERNSMQGLSEADLKKMAQQLRCPEGDEGLKIAELMNASNENMIQRTFASLDIVNSDVILEIGPGNGNHVGDIIKKYHPKRYLGIDIAPTMITKSQELCVDMPSVSFSLTDGKTIPFDDITFNKIFTVNTIYFWEDPQEYLGEIKRVLKKGGLLSIGFLPKRIMEKIPFATFGFTFWDETAVASLLEDSGFAILTEITEEETIIGNMSQKIAREFVITSARKL